jgi:hypothetical protein
MRPPNRIKISSPHANHDVPNNEHGQREDTTQEDKPHDHEEEEHGQDEESSDEDDGYIALDEDDCDTEALENVHLAEPTVSIQKTAEPPLPPAADGTEKWTDFVYYEIGPAPPPLLPPRKAHIVRLWSNSSSPPGMLVWCDNALKNPRPRPFVRSIGAASIVPILTAKRATLATSSQPVGILILAACVVGATPVPFDTLKYRLLPNAVPPSWAIVSTLLAPKSMNTKKKSNYAPNGLSPTARLVRCFCWTTYHNVEPMTIQVTLYDKLSLY